MANEMNKKIGPFAGDDRRFKKNYDSDEFIEEQIGNPPDDE